MGWDWDWVGSSCPRGRVPGFNLSTTESAVQICNPGTCEVEAGGPEACKQGEGLAYSVAGLAHKREDLRLGPYHAHKSSAPLLSR